MVVRFQGSTVRLIRGFQESQRCLMLAQSSVQIRVFYRPVVNTRWRFDRAMTQWPGTNY
jgi:hypothetical protein